jgi:hypothetical protein
MGKTIFAVVVSMEVAQVRNSWWRGTEEERTLLLVLQIS